MFECSPVYHANYESTADVVINQGGTDCFAGSQKVVTNRGAVPISEIKRGDLVKSYNEKTDKPEWKKAVNVFRFKNSKKTVRIRLKNGEIIIATEDHKFYYEGAWITLKHILSLRDGMEKDTRI